MNLPRHLTVKSFVVIALAVFLYGAGALYFGWDNIRLRVENFPFGHLAGMAGLSLVNYLLRFWRWEIFLRKLGCRLPLRPSLGLYFSCYVMVITPGKIGEVFKAGIMRERFGFPLAKGLPIVLAERLYDFLAVLILATAGLFYWPGSLGGLSAGLVAAAGCVSALVLVQNKSIRSKMLAQLGKAPIMRDHTMALADSMTALGTLLRPGSMGISLVLTVVAWLGECLGLWLACLGLGFEIPVTEATFIYAAGTLAGSLSFLPGGLGGTEAVIILLLQKLAMDATSAATAALLVRLFTLWLAVGMGLVFFLIFRRDLLSPGQDE